MASISRFYFHDATTSDTGTLPGATTIDTTTSPSQTATGASTNRSMDANLGASQTSIALTSLANTSAQPSWFRRFLSAPIGAQTISNAQTVTIACGASESSTNSNFLVNAGVYVWRPSGGGSLVGSLTPQNWGGPAAAEPSTAETWVTGSVGSESASVTSQDGDVLVVEIWRDSSTQSMSTAYTNTFFYDGTTETSASNAASYIDFSTAIVMSGGGGAPDVIPQVMTARVRT
jgi:hypothetical protein